jgi:anaerobic selenocysteine-containing dehydrogenase
MMRVGERGEGRFKRVSWDQALTFVAEKMVALKEQYGPTALLDQSYAGASYGVLHKSDQIEGLLARFLGLFGCRTSSWSVPSYQGTTFSSRMTFGTIEDGNEDDAFAHSKLIIMWGWNPAYAFHGGNTFYYMRLAKQQGCKFVLVDPQYTDSAATYDAWWIPIRPNTDGAMLAGMAHYIFTHNLHDQTFIDKFCLGMDAGTMPDWAKDQENFKDYILGKYENQPKTPEWAEPICGVKAEDIKKLADLYAKTKPAALKASWGPGRNAYGEQYNRMAAVQAMTGNIGILGGSAEGVGKAWHAEAVAYPYDQYANIWFASIKSDRWAQLRPQLPQRQARGNRPLAAQRSTRWGHPQHPEHLLAGIRLVQPAYQYQRGNPGGQKNSTSWSAWTAPSRLRACGPTCCYQWRPISSATTSPFPGTRGITTSTGRKSSSRWAKARPTSRSSPNWPTGSVSVPSTTRAPTATPS